MADDGVFPGEVTEVLKEYVAKLGKVNQTFGRPLRPEDANCSAGVFCLDWRPLDMQIGANFPILAAYDFEIQYLVKHVQQEQAIREHSHGSKNIRAMLYRDSELRVRLGQLTETTFGVVERFQKIDVTRQAFSGNEWNSNFLYLSSVNVTIETESA